MPDVEDVIVTLLPAATGLDAEALAQLPPVLAAVIADMPAADEDVAAFQSWI